MNCFLDNIISYRIRFVVHETLDVVVFIAKVYNRYDFSRNCADGSNSINNNSSTTHQPTNNNDSHTSIRNKKAKQQTYIEQW